MQMKSANNGGKQAQSARHLPAGPVSSHAVKPTCKRGTKLCQGCNQGNPIHCALCKHCGAPFPKKNKSAVQDDLLKNLESDTGRVTKSMINNLKDVLEARVFADHLFKLGKRQPGFKPSSDGNLVFPVPEQKASFSPEVKEFLEAAASRRNYSPKSPRTFSFNGVKEKGFSDKQGSAFGLKDGEVMFCAGSLGWPIESCAVWSDGQSAGMVCGISGNDKTSDVTAEDARQQLGKTQVSFGLAGLQKTGRVYPGKSYLALLRLSLDARSEER